MKETFISLSERTFILEALKKATSTRIDGRRVQDIRSVRIAFREQYGSAEVQYGKTRAYAAVSAEVVEPWPDRPTEGFFNFNVEFSPMANPVWETGRPTHTAVEAQRVIERGLRDSNAIDTESLCIVAGEKVWSVRCDVHIMDDWGNVVDCAALATIAALLHFRRPEVTVQGNDVTIHSMDERTPVPLSIHHIPICVTFGFFSELDVIVVDPELKEECVINGRMTITMNVHKELCGIQKSGGNAIMAESVVKCTKIAAVKTAELTELVNQTLEDHWNSRKRKRDRVTPVGTLPDTLHITVPPLLSTSSASSATNSNADIAKPKASFTNLTSATVSPFTLPSTTPKSIQVQQPQESITFTTKKAKKQSVTSSISTDTDTSNILSFPNDAAKLEFENFANSLVKNTIKDTKVNNSDSEEDDVIVLQNNLQQAINNTNYNNSTNDKSTNDNSINDNSINDNSTNDNSTNDNSTNDVAMHDILDSWTTQDNTVESIGKSSSVERSKGKRNVNETKKRKPKEIISLDD